MRHRPSPAPAAAAQPSPPPLQMRMACPDCDAGIDMSLASLLAGRPVFCSGCGVKLEVDLAASGEVLERVREGVEKLCAVRDRGAAAARR